MKIIANPPTIFPPPHQTNSVVWLPCYQNPACVELDCLTTGPWADSIPPSPVEIHLPQGLDIVLCHLKLPYLLSGHCCTPLLELCPFLLAPCNCNEWMIHQHREKLGALKECIILYKCRFSQIWLLRIINKIWPKVATDQTNKAFKKCHCTGHFLKGNFSLIWIGWSFKRYLLHKHLQFWDIPQPYWYIRLHPPIIYRSFINFWPVEF